MDAVVEALAAQHAELAGLLDERSEADWQALTRCLGWDVADIVLHLAQSDEMAVISATGGLAGLATESESAGATGPLDEGIARMVERERGLPSTELEQRWSTGAARLVSVLDDMDLSTRVRWVAGHLAARTLATTRLAETWIHTGDVADALSITLAPTDRLRPIARLAWRTLPYAFASAGRTMTGPVAFHLTSPDGESWDFLPDQPAATTVTGPVVELCTVAARRVEPSATSLRAEGPDAGDVLALVRTYAL